MNQGFTLWLTGLPGAGKSTLAKAVRDELVERGLRVEILDGDEVRASLSKGLTFSRADRDTNVRRIGFVTRLLSRNGVVAIAAAVSPYRDTRNDVRRDHEAAFVEVFVDCPLEELIRRDTKGLYASALPYEPPLAPEVHVRTNIQTIEQSRSAILQCLEGRGLIPSGGASSLP